jgi:MFS family permease
MRDFVIPVVVGVAAALAWMGLGAIVLRAFGIPALPRTPEERATRKQRISQMGKLRYTLIFGVLGYGFAIGLGTFVASTTGSGSQGWRSAAVSSALCGLLCGCFRGISAWNRDIRGPVPFPPRYAPPK